MFVKHVMEVKPNQVRGPKSAELVKALEQLILGKAQCRFKCSVITVKEKVQG